MSERAKKAVGTQYVPDTEDWWGDFDVNVPPPPLRVYEGRRARREGMSAFSRALMVLTGAIAVLCVCVQIYRVSLITAQNKQIESLKTQIEEMSSQKQNLEVRMSLQKNLDRIEEEALRLGMVSPDGSQVRVIAIAGTNDGVVTAYAAGAEEGGLENSAP